MWDTACLDWEARLLAGRSLVPELPLNVEQAARALRSFNRLKLPDVIGCPPMAEAGADWFRDIVAALFGAYDPVANVRNISEVFLLVPKKNGKSSYAAALMVVAMILNRRPLAEALLIAPTKQIADIAFKQAKGIITADPELAKLFHPQEHIRKITHRRTGASLQIKAADTDAITGSKSTYVLIDETHEFAKKSNAAAVFIEVRGGLAARPDGFLIQITTQSKEPPAGVFKDELAIARKVRDGELKLPRLAVLYELPERLQKDNGWKVRRLWGFVNPNLGRSVYPPFLDQQLIAAEETGREALALLASQHFNVQVGLSLRSDRWAGADYWEQRADPTLTLDELIRRSEVAVVGIDGGGLDDLLGLAVIGRERGTHRLLIWARAWAHDDVLERRKEIAPRLQDFEKAGDLTIIGHNGGPPLDDVAPADQHEDAAAPTLGDDITGAVDVVIRLRDAGLLPEKGAVGLDAVGVADIVDELLRRGLTEDQLQAIPQGYRLASAIWGLERALKLDRASHCGSDLLAWCVGNAKAEARGNAVLITKQAAGKAKIDPLCAIFDAFELMSHNPEPGGGRSYVETSEVLII
jgi:phage terminase large subunit-like protein